MISAGDIGCRVVLDDKDARATLNRFIQDALAAAEQIRLAFKNALGGIGAGGFQGVNLGGMGGGGAGGGNVSNVANTANFTSNALTQNLQQNLTQTLNQAISSVTNAFSAAVTNNVSSVANTTINNIRTPGAARPSSWFGIRPMAAAFLAYRGLEALGQRYSENRALEETMEFGTPMEAFKMIRQQTESQRGGIGEFARWGISNSIFGSQLRWGSAAAGTTFETDSEKIAHQRITQASSDIADRAGVLAFEARMLGKERPLIGTDPATRGIGEAGIVLERRQQESGLARQYAGRVEGMFGLGVGGGVLRHAADDYEREAKAYYTDQTAFLRRERTATAGEFIYSGIAAGFAGSGDPHAAAIAAMAGRFSMEGLKTRGEDPELHKARAGANTAELNALYRRIAAEEKSMAYQASAITLGMQGQDYEAGLAGVEARFTQFRNPRTGEMASWAQPLYQAMRADVGLEETRRRIGLGASAAGLQALLGRKPLQAEIAALTGDFAKATAGTSIFSAEYGEQSVLLGLRIQEAQQRRGDTENLLNIGISGRGAQIARLLARDPIGAEAIGIGTAGLSQSAELANRGFGQQAKDVLTNTAAELQLLKQNYGLAFRAETVDARLMRIDNPRDVQDPNEVWQTISDTLQRIERALTDDQSGGAGDF